MILTSRSPSISVHAGTDKGRRREKNEDSYNIVQLKNPLMDVTLVVVADGVGGLEAGELASRIGSLTFSSDIIDSLINARIKNLNINDIDIMNFIYQAVNDANSKIGNALSNAGTTLVAALMIPTEHQVLTYIINVGDSRAYLIDKESWEIYQLTRDHSVAWADFEEKELKKFWSKSVDRHELARVKFNYIKTHPRAHIITNVVGYYGKVGGIEIIKIGLDRKDRLLLCTDGLTDMLDDYEIVNIMKESEDPVGNLIEKANERGGDDNITIAIIDII
jgi:protein phosphatase